jgi:hypothetical protein
MIGLLAEQDNVRPTVPGQQSKLNSGVLGRKSHVKGEIEGFELQKAS